MINVNDPYSIKVGQFYIDARQLTESQVLRVELPLRAELTPDEFRVLDERIRQFFGTDTQALALAWSQPFAVDCNSITGALALGFDSALCSKTCAPSRKSSYLNAYTSRPFTDLQMRPSMLLAAKNVAMAEDMISRGVASDHTLGLRGSPPVNAHFLATSDNARSSRAPCRRHTAVSETTTRLAPRDTRSAPPGASAAAHASSAPRPTTTS